MVWLDRLYLPLMAALSVFVAVANFHAQHIFHTIDKHLVFRARILHGFDTGVVVPSYPIPPTFPMWGYGFVLVLTTNKALLIALQIAVALFSVWYLLRVLDELRLVDGRTRIVLRLLLVCCTPWYVYHTIDWSQSLATSFFVLSFALLIRIAHNEPARWRTIALSAVCLGLNLNFASDLYLLPVPLALAAWWCRGFSRSAAAQMAVWALIVGATLLPWMIYTAKAVGTPLVKSTNQGHVLLIGLGQDPQKRFGFTYSDNDVKMYGILRERLGERVAQRFYASCSFEADQVLRPAFVQTIAEQPLAYLDLARTKLLNILRGDTGTYSGEFDQGENVGRFGIGIRLRTVVQRYTEHVGHLLQLGTTVFVPLILWRAARRQRSLMTLVLAPIAYQYTNCSFAVLQAQYLSNLILLQVLICALGLGYLASFILQEPRHAA